MMLHFGIFLESRCPVNHQSRSCFTLQVFMDRILVFLWHMNSTFRLMIVDRELQEFGANEAISILFQPSTTQHLFLFTYIWRYISFCWVSNLIVNQSRFLFCYLKTTLSCHWDRWIMNYTFSQVIIPWKIQKHVISVGMNVISSDGHLFK